MWICSDVPMQDGQRVRPDPEAEEEVDHQQRGLLASSNIALQ